MISYEIHTFQGGQWKTDSVFDTREIALLEAQKIIDGGRHFRIQVLEENYDEQTNETTTRMIFKGGRTNDKKPTEKTNSTKTSSTEKRSTAGREAARQTRRAAPAKKRASLVLPVTILSLIIAVGLATLIGLRYYV